MKQEVIKQAWEKYVLNKEEIPEYIHGVRDEIVASWRRCQKHLDARFSTTRMISEKEYQERLIKNALLIEVAYPYLSQFIEDLEEANFMIELTDQEGCMLKSLGNTALLNNMIEKNNFFNGYFFGEQDAGTGGVGLALALKQPVIVKGYEHYNEYYHSLVCYGAPIQDPDGQLIGSISITGLLENHQPVIMGMVKAAKNGIERELNMTRTNQILNSTIDSVSPGIIVLDANNEVLYFNLESERLIDYSIKVGQSIEQIIQLEDIQKLYDQLYDQEAHEITLLNHYNKPLYLSITMKQIHNKEALSSKVLIIESQIEKHRIASLLSGFKANYTFNDLKGVSPVIDSLKELGSNIAKLDLSFLLSGERGCEEDIFSEAIHNGSVRRDYPFIRVDCTAFSSTNIINELFGNTNQLGKIQLSNKGTLFLYEIGSLSLEVQERLYQFLKKKEIQDVHSSFMQKCDTRIIAYSSVNLLELVEKGRFNRQLYYLLNVINLSIPPLRERKEDIPVLVNMLIRRYTKQLENPNIRFNQDCIKAMSSYHWPGNVKQLENVVEAAVFSTSNEVIQLSQLPLDLVNDYYANDYTGKTLLQFNQERNDSELTKEMQEYNELLFAIKETNGDVRKASKILYIPLSTLYRKLKKFEINPKEYK